MTEMGAHSSATLVLPVHTTNVTLFNALTNLTLYKWLLNFETVFNAKVHDHKAEKLPDSA